MARLAELAQTLGYALSGRGAERRLSLCPACRDGPGDAALNVEQEVWKCHRASCQEGGGPVAFVAWHEEGRPWADLDAPARKRVRDAMAAMGLARDGPTRPRAEAVPPPPPRRLTAPSRWDAALADRAGVDLEAAAWLECRMGPELAKALLSAALPLLVAPPRASEFWRWARQVEGYRVAIPVYAWTGPDKGHVADCRLRWCGPGPAPGDGKRKELGLANAVTDAAGLARFMGDPTRVTTTTPAIVITEGGTDYLAAEALRLAGHLPKTWAIVGLPGAGTAESLGSALGAHLTELDVLEDTDAPRHCRRVILAIDADAGGDTACHDLFVALRRSGAPVEVHRPGHWPRGADLGDRLALLGAEATAAEILASGPYAPPALAHVSPIYGDGEPTALADARASLPARLATLVEAARTGTRSVLAVPPGSGKTTAALMLALSRAQGADHPQLVMALPSWRLARQKRRELETLAAANATVVRTSEWVGVGEACHNGKHPASGEPILARDAFLASGRPAGWRRLVCPDCPLKPRCRAHKKPSVRADIVFTTHASLAHLPPEWAGRFVVVIDEAPEAVEVTAWSIAHLRSPDEAVWAGGDDPDTLDALDTLHRAWSYALRAPTLAIAGQRPASRHAERREGRALGRALLQAAHRLGGAKVVDDMLGYLEAASEVDPRALPRTDIHRLLREGYADSRITVRRDLHRLYGAVLEVMRAELEDGEPEPATRRLALVLPAHGQDRSPTFELRTPVMLRPGFGSVTLDATGLVTPHLHTSYLGPDIVMEGIPVLPGAESRTVRIHVRHRGLARSRLLPAGERTWARLARVVKQAVAQATVHAGQGWVARKAGLLTYRALTASLDQDCAEGALVAWQAAVRGLATDGVRVGYFGGTSRASNDFEDVDLLVTLGDPWPDVSARRSDLAAMGLDEDEVTLRMRAEVEAELAQAMGRARAEVRAGTVVLLHIGAVCPAGWDARTVITIEPPRRGRQAAPDLIVWKVWLEDAAEALGALSAPLVSAYARVASDSPELDIEECPISNSGESGEAGARWLEALHERLGPMPLPLPPAPRLRELVARVTDGEHWRAIGTTRDRIRVRADLSDEEGRHVVAFVNALVTATLTADAEVPAHFRWWPSDAAALPTLDASKGQASAEPAAALPAPPANPSIHAAPRENDMADVDSCPFGRSQWLQQMGAEIDSGPALSSDTSWSAPVGKRVRGCAPSDPRAETMSNDTHPGG